MFAYTYAAVYVVELFECLILGKQIARGVFLKTNYAFMLGNHVSLACILQTRVLARSLVQHSNIFLLLYLSLLGDDGEDDNRIDMMMVVTCMSRKCRPTMCMSPSYTRRGENELLPCPLHYS